MSNSNNKVFKSKVPMFLVWLRDTFAILLSFFFRRRKLSGNLEGAPPFFIIGCGRSGNTLLRSILMAGDEVAIPPESYVWPRVIRRYKAYSFLPWDILSSIVVSEFVSFKEFYTWEINLDKVHKKVRELPKNERTLAHILNKIYQEYLLQKEFQNRRWGDKTPINTIYADKILKVFPEAQFIYIERDPRDVVCSYVKAGLYKDYVGPARFWKASYNMSLKLKRRLSKHQFLNITYEDLVSDPRTTAKLVCDFLGIEYKKDMLDFWKETENLGDVNYAAHHKNIKSPISTASIGNWKDILSDKDLAIVERITQIK